MSFAIARVKIEKGTEILPTILKIEFSPMPWNFAFHQGRLEKWMGSEEECQKLEVRHAVEKAAYMIQRELIDAVDKQLGIKL